MKLRELAFAKPKRPSRKTPAASCRTFSRIESPMPAAAHAQKRNFQGKQRRGAKTQMTRRERLFLRRFVTVKWRRACSANRVASLAPWRPGVFALRVAFIPAVMVKRTQRQAVLIS